MPARLDQLSKHMVAAAAWLAGPACCHENIPVGVLGRQFGYQEWRGAIRGEYHAATGIWNSFCPYWHTGQAVKALVLTAKALGASHYLKDAAFSAHFLLANQRRDGLFPAREVRAEEINTSAILESLDGLLLLSEATGDARYRNAALAALDWVARRAWMPDRALFRDIYCSERDEFVYDTPSAQDRPLLDDAVFLAGFRLTGERRYREIALATAETLLATENPPGNWIGFIPCKAERELIHPRHAFWWGLPMRELYHETGDERFRAVFFRAAEWYRRALRHDGGFFRDTYSDFNTASFGHATSGAACAARCFIAAFRESGDVKWLEPAERALNFCCAMQFAAPADPNLKGAVLEKVLPPDGTDASPYYIRDLGTIFFLQAAAEYLLLQHKTRSVKTPKHCMAV